MSSRHVLFGSQPSGGGGWGTRHSRIPDSQAPRVLMLAEGGICPSPNAQSLCEVRPTPTVISLGCLAQEGLGSSLWKE